MYAVFIAHVPLAGWFCFLNVLFVLVLASMLHGARFQEVAERGEALFRSTCSECHDSADWTETGFKGRWEEQSVYQLWYYVNERMPYDDPWSLSRQQTTDVLTYIFQLNGLPTGETELATDDDSIDDYWIAWGSSRP